MVDTTPSEPASALQDEARACSFVPAFPELQLPTQRLILRPLALEDAQALFQICSDPAVMRYAGSLPWSVLAQAQQRIERHLAAHLKDEYLCLGLFRQDNARLLGTCTLFNLSEQCRRAEIGYILARPLWGCGYMHEALVALIDYGIQAIQLNRIEADVDPRNLASVKSLQRLGFHQEGYLRERWIVAGEVSDSALYGLLASAWLLRRAGSAHASG